MLISSIPLIDIVAYGENCFHERLSLTPTRGNPHPVLSNHTKNDGYINSICILTAALSISERCNTMRSMLCLVNPNLVTSLQSVELCTDVPVNSSKLLLISSKYIPGLSNTISSRMLSSASDSSLLRPLNDPAMFASR